jgi:uncharacterized membrane protein
MPAHYRIIGADGNEYGPASLEELSRWIREGRVVPTTQVRRGEEAAVEAQSLPELAPLFTSPAPTGAAPGAAPVPGATPSPAAASLQDEFRVWAFMGHAWELVRDNWLHLAGMFFIFTAIGSIRNFGPYVELIFGGVLMVGIWQAILGMLDGRKPDIGMMFGAFDRFGDAFLAHLVISILTTLGLLCFIVPGIILYIVWFFTYAVLAENRARFWDAMQQSFALTEGYRWRLFLLMLACLPILILGLMAAIVGVFVALPVCLTAFALAYRWLQARNPAVVAAPRVHPHGDPNAAQPETRTDT